MEGLTATQAARRACVITSLVAVHLVERDPAFLGSHDFLGGTRHLCESTRTEWRFLPLGIVLKRVRRSRASISSSDFTIVKYDRKTARRASTGTSTMPDDFGVVMPSHLRCQRGDARAWSTARLRRSGSTRNARLRAPIDPGQQRDQRRNRLDRSIQGDRSCRRHSVIKDAERTFDRERSDCRIFVPRLGLGERLTLRRSHAHSPRP